MVSNVALLLTLRFISKSNKELASSKSQESVVSVCFSILVVPDLRLLSCSVDFSNLLVKGRSSIEVSPERLSVLRVVTSSEVLLRSVVNEWNTSCCHRENNGRSESSVITIVIKESSVVMVINKRTKSINIFEVLLLSGVTLAN